MEASGRLHGPAVLLRLGRTFYTIWLGGWVGQQSLYGRVDRKTIFSPTSWDRSIDSH
jgi:hypothetical protein